MTAEEAAPVDFVDPFIGTDFFGHMFPGATLPYGMVQLSPDNDTDGWTYSAGYAYENTTIRGFSHTHLSGVGYTACGDVLLMPTVGDKVEVMPGTEDDPDSGYRSRFDHKDEIARPGYYSVILRDYNIRAELTTTRRVGMHRYTFPEAEKAPVILDLGHTIGGSFDNDFSRVTIVNDTLVRGVKDSKGVKVYFVMVFNKPFRYYGTFDAGYYTPESGASVFPYKNEEKGKDIGAFFVYHPEEGEQLMVKVAISYVSEEGAIKNLEAELPHWNFDQVRWDALDTWNRELSRIKVKTDSHEKKVIFYTAVYHSLVAQMISQDVDGQYFGMDGKVYKMEEGDFYPNFSCWDTYRSQHPLLTILTPEHVDDMMNSIVAKTEHFGWLPSQHFRNEFRPSMVGDHLIPVVADAYAKGYGGFDIEFLYEAMRRKALGPPPSDKPADLGRSGITDYINKGYAPYDKVTEAVPNTLELAYDDWCIAQIAKSLGKEDDYQMFMSRAYNYKNLYDAETKFMRPKDSKGVWLPAINGHKQEIVHNGDHSYYKYFDPLLVGRRPNRHYTESNAWQYLWSVQHDPVGLIELLGGNDAFAERLDEFFTMSPTITPPKYVGVVGTIGQYVQGNQPSHHVAYLYNYARKPWKTQKWVRKVTEELYRSGPGGLCGNEDMGSLSSWYILSVMGFYSVTPGQTQYVIGSPLFDEVTIDVGNDKTFKIIAENNYPGYIYIQSAELNGKEFNRTWIDHKEIMAGGTLMFVMGPEPNKNWGVDEHSAPYSMSR